MRSISLLTAHKAFFNAASVAVLVTSFAHPGFAQSGPCDILSSATPCVAAFSTVRALYASYTGPLYQVKRASDNTTTNVGTLPDGFANSSTQDTFCSNTTCTITKIYDQTSNHNNLTPAPPGGKVHTPDLPAVANALPVAAGGQKVYGVYISPGMGYRDDSTTGIATGSDAQGVYMVSSTSNLDAMCCFDFGNAETNNDDNGDGHMDAINLGCTVAPPSCDPENGLDLEMGIKGRQQVTEGTPFVSDLGWNDGKTDFQLYWGNAQSGGLTTPGSTALPSGYAPMHQEGAIILGIGGDNSNWGSGEFFEGVMTMGAPSTSSFNSVQANIVSVQYSNFLASPSSINFGTLNGTLVCSETKTSSVTVENLSSQTIGISGVSIIDGTSTAFRDSNGCGSMLAAGDSCTIGVSFDVGSSIEGSNTATLQISNVSVPLSATVNEDCNGK